jgi:hypothetical protein
MKGLMLVAFLAGVPKGGTLYVHGAGVKLLSKADAHSRALTPLDDGQAVVWSGADVKNPAMQRIEVRGKSGYVETSQLTPYPPEPASPPALRAGPTPPPRCTGPEEQCAALVQLSASSQYQRTQAAAVSK